VELDGTARWVARYFVDLMRERRNLLRALALHVRAHPEVVDDATRARRVAQHEFLVDALVAAGAEAGAARTAIFFAASAIRERILFSDATHASTLPHSDAELERDTARMLAGFLRDPTERRT
jgi:hypothetical protein